MRTIDQFTEQYLREHPEEIGDMLAEAAEEYEQDGDSATLLSLVKITSRVLQDATITPK